MDTTRPKAPNQLKAWTNGKTPSINDFLRVRDNRQMDQIREITRWSVETGGESVSRLARRRTRLSGIVGWLVFFQVVLWPSNRHLSDDSIAALEYDDTQ